MVGPRLRRGWRKGRRAIGFTLIELLVAVGLLVLILTAVAYVFSTTGQVISRTQGITETHASLEAFQVVLRKDIRGIERGGFLVLGGRSQSGYGSLRDRSDEYKSTFRNDWMLLFVNSEHDVSGDTAVIGQVCRVLYGHGRVSDSKGWGFKGQTSSYPLLTGQHDLYSELGTDWVVMRHQISVLADVHQTPNNPASLYGLGFEAMEVSGPLGGDEGLGSMFQRSLLSYCVRDFRWHGWTNYQWIGSVTVDYGPPGNAMGRLAIFEPLYYHYLRIGEGDPRRFHALPHCADFRVQYAMAEHLTAGPGGTVQWQDPLMFSGSSNPGRDDGRLVFGPGDRWPAMLRVTVHVFDPDDRFEGGKRTTMVLNLP